MSNFVLGWVNNVVLGTVTASGDTAGLSADKLQDDQVNAASALQIPSTSGAILVTMPTATTWQGLGLFGTNLTSAAVVDWYIIGGTYLGRSPPVAPGFRQAVLVTAAAASGTQLQVNISDPSNPDGFLNIPGMFAGPLWQPIRNFSPASQPGRASARATTTNRAGGVTVRPDWIKRTFDLALSGVRPSEVPTVMAADAAGRQGSNVFFAPDSTSSTLAQDVIFGELEPADGITYPANVPAVRGWRAKLTERL